MYFKILPIRNDKYTDMGMINIDAQLFLESGDEGYYKYVAEHLITVDGAQQLNPFCTHSIQFEHDATEEEILWCFEWALGITHWNYLMDDLHCQKKDENGNPYSQVVNQNIHYAARKNFYQASSNMPDNLKSDYVKAELGKVDKAKSRVVQIKDVDFVKVKTVGKYKVK